LDHFGRNRLVCRTRVHNTKDFAIAGRQLPFYMVTATVFATWFGAEAVLGIPQLSSMRGCTVWWPILLARPCV